MAIFSSWTHDPCESSGFLPSTTNAVVMSQPGIFGGAQLFKPIVANPNDFIVLIDSSTEASGTVVGVLAFSGVGSYSLMPSRGVRCLNGIYASVNSGGTSSYFVAYFTKVNPLP